jgi:hypothetical protein
MTTADGLVVVAVRDRINPALAGHEGCAYTSPPQRREHALSLVALLLGCPSDLVDDRHSWTTSVAGGRRTITLTTIHP